jgi:hypothetical protein
MPVHGKQRDARTQCSFVGDHPFRSVTAKQRNDITRYQAGCSEGSGDGIDIAIKMAEGHHAPVSGDDGGTIEIALRNCGDLSTDAVEFLVDHVDPGALGERW